MIQILMRFKGIFFIFIYVCFINVSVNGQDENRKLNKKDSIKEVIVYEYDTVYVAPDTLKLTDTIIQYQVKERSVESKRNSHPSKLNFDFLSNFNFLKSFDEQWSLGFGVSTSITGLLQKNNEVDSFSRKRTVNSVFELHLNYRVHQFKYSLGFGYLRYHEKLQYQRNSYMDNTPTSTGYYDSLMIKNNVTANNYYQYLQVFCNVGRKWGNREIFFVLNGYILSNILLNASAVTPTSPALNINSSSVQKLDFQSGINPCIGFKVLRQSELSIGPFCNYSMLSNKKFPSSDQLFIGFSCRIQ